MKSFIAKRVKPFLKILKGHHYIVQIMPFETYIPQGKREYFGSYDQKYHKFYYFLYISAASIANIWELHLYCAHIHPERTFKAHNISNWQKSVLRQNSSNTLKISIQRLKALLEYSENLKPQESFSRFVKKFLDLQKVDHTIRKHH